jgi:hypothetical protein
MKIYQLEEAGKLPDAYTASIPDPGSLIPAP